MTYFPPSLAQAPNSVTILLQALRHWLKFNAKSFIESSMAILVLRNSVRIDKYEEESKVEKNFFKTYVQLPYEKCQNSNCINLSEKVKNSSSSRDRR